MKIRELERKLRMAGCWFVVHGKRHDQWYSPITDLMFSIPRHGTKEVPNGTLREILKQSGVKFRINNLIMSKITSFIEIGKDGLFAVCTRSNKYHIMILGCGDTVEEAMEDFYECRDEVKEFEEAAGRSFPNLEFDFVYDTESFLRYYGNILTLTGLQKITGIHHKQLSHYATGQSRPTSKTVRRIQEGINRFADTLKQVRLV